MEVQRVLHMKGGEGKESYAQNSTLQRMALLKVKPILEEAIKKLCSADVPECINIADLGCSSGPNTFCQVEEIIDCIDRVSLRTNQKPPSVQVFLNDLEGNDFNTVFKSLPAFYNKLAEIRNGDRKSGSCFVAAMPGSFYVRLFPSNSMHFVNSSFSLHWLSQVPLSEGNINIARTSAPEVQKAYLDQFGKDFTTFLKMRSEEMRPEGYLVLTVVAKVDADDGSDPKEVIGMILNDMVKEGLVEETKLDGFNLPIYNPAAEEVRQIIENEGSFKILHLETFKQRWTDVYEAGTGTCSYGEFVAKSIRAIFEDIVASHFGEAIMDELFHKYSVRALDYMKAGKDRVNHVVVSLAKANNPS